MVTNCLPLFYVRPTGQEENGSLKRYMHHLRVKHELVRSNSASAVDEIYDYARPEVTVAKHKNLCRKNSDPMSVHEVKQAPLSNGVHCTAKVSNIERRPPVPKPRTTTLAKMGRTRSETDLLDSEDKDTHCEPCPYETASVTFNSSDEKLYRPGSTSPTGVELPPAPSTFKLHFRSHCGWLVKLSKQKGWYLEQCVEHILYRFLSVCTSGIFGADKWQKRYFVLNGNRLFYFKKYGVSR